MEAEGPGPPAGPPPAAKATATAWESTANLANACIGAGVLAMPHAFALTGWAGGFLLSGAAGAAVGFSLLVVVEFGEKQKAASFQGLVGAALGEVWGRLMAVVLAVWFSGVCSGYLIIIRDAAESLCGQGGGAPETCANHALWLPPLAAVAVLPMLFGHQLQTIAKVGSFVVFAILYLAVFVLVKFVHEMDQREEWEAFHASVGSLRAAPIHTYAFMAQLQVCQVYNELDADSTFSGGGLPWRRRGRGRKADSGGDSEEDEELLPLNLEDGSAGQAGLTPPRSRKTSRAAELPTGEAWGLRGRSRKMALMTRVIRRAIGLCIASYSVVGLFGYLSAPPDVWKRKSNLLRGVYREDGFSAVAEVLMALVACISYPINFLPFRQTLHDLLAVAGVKVPARMHVAFTVAIFGATVALALAIKELGDVFEIFGSIGGAFIVFILPAQFIRREGGGRGRLGSEIMLNACGLLLLAAICVAGLRKA